MELVTLENVNNSAYVSKEAVKALMARNYLYMQNWEKARDYATELIESDYLALSKANTLYTSDMSYYQYLWKYDAGSEIIWKIGFTTTSYGGALGQPFWAITIQLTYLTMYQLIGHCICMMKVISVLQLSLSK